MAGSSLIGNLAVSLSMETAAFNKGARQAEQRVSKLQRSMNSAGGAIKGAMAGFVAGFGIETITGAISRGLEYASSLGEVAQQLGVTTTALQEYRFAATQAGISQSEMDAGLAKLSRSIGEAQQGAKPMVAAFERLGISMADLQGKGTGDVMKMVADGLNQIPDPAQRAAIAVDLFGRSGQKLMPLLNEGAKGINAYAAAAKEMGVVLDEAAIKKADEAADKMAKLKTVLEARIAGVVAENATSIMKLTDELGKLAERLLGVIGNLGKLTEKLTSGDTQGAWESFKGFASSAIEAVHNSFLGLPMRVGKYLGDLVAKFTLYLRDKLGEAADWVGQKLKWLGDQFYKLYDRVVGHSYVPDMVDEIGHQMDRLDDVMVAPASAAADKTAAAFARLGDQVGSISFVPDIDAEDVRNSHATPDEDDPLREVRVSQKEWMDSLPDLSKGAKQSTGEVMMSFARMAEGVAMSLRDMVDSFKHGDIWDKITAIANVIGEVIRGIQSMGGLGGTQSGGGFGGFRAMGGPTVPGKSYIVGENGPEWFTPGSRGFVTPSNDNSRGGTMQIVPSPYFDVVVDGRVVHTAGPMAQQAVAGGSAGALSKMARRQARTFP